MERAIDDAKFNASPDIFSVRSDGLSENAFPERRDIKILHLEEGERSVPASAYKSCGQLKEVSFPSSLESIEAFAFERCFSLEEAVFPEGTKVIGASAFRNCLSLKRVVVPDSLENIAMGAFSGCKSLMKVDLPDDLERLGTWAFSCSGIQSFRVPSSLSSLGQGTFAGCENLWSVHIPANVKRVGEKCFSGCLSLKHVEIEEGVEDISQYAFFECPSLEYLRLPETITRFSRWFGYKPYTSAVYAPGVKLSDANTISYAMSLTAGFIREDMSNGTDARLWAQYAPFIQEKIFELCEAEKYRGAFMEWLMNNGLVSNAVFDQLLDISIARGYTEGTAQLLEHAEEFGHGPSGLGGGLELL